MKLHEADFSKSEYKVYQLISQKPKIVETYTISKIANDSNTSVAAVQRFCQTLGFDGYKDFRFEMTRELQTLQEKKAPDNLFEQFTDDYSSTIQQLKSVDIRKIEALAQDLNNSDSIYIYGIHYSAIPAAGLSFGLQDLGKANYLARDLMECSHASRTVNSESVLVHFSVSGTTYQHYKYLDVLTNSMPEKSYLITMNPKAAASRNNPFRHTIILPGSKLTNQSIVDAQGIFLVFVEGLLNLIHQN